MALAPYAQDDHYNPVPLVVSASDKTEKGDQIARWIQVLIDQYNNHIFGKVLHGPIYSIGSDGNAFFRKAQHIICIKTPINPASELGQIVCSLLGLNTFTSPEGITGTCDPKHVFKHQLPFLSDSLFLIALS